jgi:MFS family permease
MGKYSTRAFFLGLLGLAFANLDHSLFALVLTQIKQDLGWSEADRGLFLCVTFVIAGLVVTQIGVLADRYGRKRMLLISMLLTPLFVVALAFSRSTPSMLLWRTLGFATAGAQSPLTGTLVIEESPPRYRGLLSGILQIGYPLGWALAALLLVPLVWDGDADPAGYRRIFFLSLLGLPVAWLFYRYLREPPAWEQARAAQTEMPSTRVLFTRPYRARALSLFAGQFLQVFAYGATILLVAYFQESRGWTFDTARTAVGWSYLVGSLGYVAAAVLGEFVLRRRDVIVIWLWLGAAAFAYAIWGASTVRDTTLAFCATTFFFYGATAVIFTFTAESFPAAVRATAVSFSGSLGVNLGIAFGPLVTELLVPQVGWAWAFTWAGIVPLILGGFLYLAVPNTRWVAAT